MDKKRITAFLIDPLNNLDNTFLADIARSETVQVRLCQDGVRRTLWPVSAYNFLVIVMETHIRDLAEAFVELEDGTVVRFNNVLSPMPFPLEILEYLPSAVPIKRGQFTLDASSLEAYEMKVMKAPAAKPRARSDYPRSRVPRKLGVKSKK